jgi:putative hemolysin
MLPSILLLLVFVLLSAFFNSSETGFIASNRTTLEHLEGKGSKPAGRVRRILARINDFLTTILIGNTLVNAAAASLATYIAGTFVADEEQAVILADEIPKPVGIAVVQDRHHVNVEP